MKSYKLTTAIRSAVGLATLLAIASLAGAQAPLAPTPVPAPPPQKIEVEKGTAKDRLKTFKDARADPTNPPGQIPPAKVEVENFKLGR